ncbi:MAG: hypothetical protein HY596_02240 [Candidatus Omnitrophica bacterium]|nr:hypothetical protein [Candidatus Omnitrophota bacterium]
MKTAFPFQQDQLILRPPKPPLALALILMLGLAVGGAWLAWQDKLVGWVVAVGCGFGSSLALLQLLPNSTYVRLSDQGLVMCSLFRARSLKWTDVQWCSATKRGIRVHYLVGGRARTVEMPAEPYRMKPRELAELANKWRVRAAHS